MPLWRSGCGDRPDLVEWTDGTVTLGLEDESVDLDITFAIEEIEDLDVTIKAEITDHAHIDPSWMPAAVVIAARELAPTPACDARIGLVVSIFDGQTGENDNSFWGLQVQVQLEDSDEASGIAP